MTNILNYINIDQKACISHELQHESRLTIKHSTILDYISKQIEYKKRSEYKEYYTIDHNNELFVKIDYETIKNELPLLLIKDKKTIARYIKDLVRFELLDQYISKSNQVYYRLLDSAHNFIIHNKGKDTHKSYCLTEVYNDIKPFITINQHAFLRLAHKKKAKITLKHCTILDYIHYFTRIENNTIDRKTIENKNYSWVAYNKLITDLPMLKIKSKSSIYKYFNYLIKLGVIEKYTDCETSQVYIRLTDYALNSLFKPYTAHGLKSCKKDQVLQDCTQDHSLQATTDDQAQLQAITDDQAQLQAITDDQAQLQAITDDQAELQAIAYDQAEVIPATSPQDHIVQSITEEQTYVINGQSVKITFNDLFNLYTKKGSIKKAFKKFNKLSNANKCLIVEVLTHKKWGEFQGAKNRKYLYNFQNWIDNSIFESDYAELKNMTKGPIIKPIEQYNIKAESHILDIIQKFKSLLKGRLTNSIITHQDNMLLIKTTQAMSPFIMSSAQELKGLFQAELHTKVNLKIAIMTDEEKAHQSQAMEILKAKAH